ncbi:MAG: homoserine O-acetyltransferase MetX [Gammaproteobacteria bacterium]
MNSDTSFSGDTLFLALPAFTLESGEILPQVTVAYRSWGRLNVACDNVVLVCHALTGSANADQWWRGLMGPGKALDPERDFILCSNVLGSCYGTTGPRSINPVTDKSYGGHFPVVSVRDMVRVQAQWLDALGIAQLRLVIGGSLGGMQVLEWAVLYPERVAAIAPIATSGRQSAWAIGLSEAQRQAIYADANWQGGYYRPDQAPAVGLAAARMFAMCSYRHWREFNRRFGRRQKASGEFQMESYLRYQGAKLARRFDAATYVRLTEAMDTHDLARDRGDYYATLAAIATPALVVGVTSDGLYPLAEQQELAALLPNAELAVLDSLHGHDAFLIETDRLNQLLLEFRARHAGTAPIPMLKEIRSCVL